MADNMRYLGARIDMLHKKLLAISPASTGFKELREKVISGSVYW